MSAFPFRVEYGYSCQESTSFATFDFALVFYRGYIACSKTRHRVRKGFDAGPRLVNIDNIDGAEDSSAAAQHGLTAEQWEQVEAVG